MARADRLHRQARRLALRPLACAMAAALGGLAAPWAQLPARAQSSAGSAPPAGSPTDVRYTPLSAGDARLYPQAPGQDAQPGFGEGLDGQERTADIRMHDNRIGGAVRILGAGDRAASECVIRPAGTDTGTQSHLSATGRTMVGSGAAPAACSKNKAIFLADAGKTELTKRKP